MESLLSLAFDNLASYDSPKIRKGLKQIEGLLAPICLAPAQPVRRGGLRRSPCSSSSSSPSSSPPPPRRRELADLGHDPAFREFFRLQEGFQWNVVAQLVKTLDRLLAKSSDGQNDLLIVAALDLTRGILLLHPPSRLLFEREQNMNLLLDLLEPCNCAAIQSSTLLVLVTAFLGHPRNTRVFEALDGLLLVSSLFKDRATPREVKMKVVEFLYFYLMPEAPVMSPRHRRNRGVSVSSTAQRTPSKLVRRGSVVEAEAPPRPRPENEFVLSTAVKTALLGRHLRNVEDLVRDLGGGAPFGNVVA